MRIDTPPFSILALAPFSPALETDHPPVVTIGSLSLDEALAELAPALDISVDRALCPDGSVAVTIKRMADFRPKNLLRNTPFLRSLKEAKAYVEKGGSPADLTAQFPGVAPLLDLATPAKTNASRAKGNAIDDILDMVDTETTETPSASPSAGVPEQIDRITDRLLAAILADPDFRRMESAWRGAELAAGQVPSGTETTVLFTLVPLADDPDHLFEMLTTQMASMPPDCIVLDMPLSNSARHMAVLESAMNFAEAMLAPIFVPMGPKFLGIETWDDIHSLPFIPARLEGAEYGRWKTLTQRTAAGWVVPCISGVTTRPMHPGETAPLFASAAWGVCALCARSIALHGRSTRLADRGTVRLENLSLTETATPSPLEVLPDRDRLADFKQAGILPLAAAPGKDHVFTLGAVTMDGGPLPFRLFLSRLTGFLISMAMYRHEEVVDIEKDLAQAVTLFIQAIGLPAPSDVEVVAHEEQDGMTPLAITLTPDEEILPGGNRFTFGFGW